MFRRHLRFFVVRNFFVLFSRHGNELLDIQKRSDEFVNRSRGGRFCLFEEPENCVDGILFSLAESVSLFFVASMGLGLLKSSRVESVNKDDFEEEEIRALQSIYETIATSGRAIIEMLRMFPSGRIVERDRLLYRFAYF